MTNSAKVTMTTVLTGDSKADADVIDVYLTLAGQKMLERLYPFEDISELTLPEQYDVLQCELAARMYNRRGAEGETAHSENSVSRTYDSVNDEDILLQLTPFAKIL